MIEHWLTTLIGLRANKITKHSSRTPETSTEIVISLIHLAKLRQKLFSVDFSVI